jgi:hypothetical protein
MAAKLTRLTHKIAIKLHLVAESYGQSGNFWIHPHMLSLKYIVNNYIVDTTIMNGQIVTVFYPYGKRLQSAVTTY